MKGNFITQHAPSPKSLSSQPLLLKDELDLVNQKFFMI